MGGERGVQLQAPHLLLLLLLPLLSPLCKVFTVIYEGWNFNSGNYLFTTDTK